ncbi:lytic murein transglycosylase B [Undibacterium sp. LFS511W]|uniref:Lytic murein transglycosylase B n=2 Tax=Undibacterium luofuense TaxID=2828733 RepID=A0A941DLX7_9BURK|nr:lytic murein transglycosylase B [Undibacterium luofuense]
MLLVAGATAIHAPAAAAKTKTKKTVPQQAPATPVASSVRFSDFNDVKVFIQELQAKHILDEAAANRFFSEAVHLEKVKQLIKPAPAGKPKNWQAYRSRFIESIRIEKGLRFWEENEATLARAEAEFGIPQEIIVGLIGIETLYGRNTGNFRVADALATLAFDYPETPNKEARQRFFRDELEALLVMAQQSQSDPFAYKGSYAGAIGLPQFMPGSILRYAVDYDRDGKIDLANSPADAIGSVANYLAKHGWKKSIPVAFPAALLLPQDHPSIKEAIDRGLKATFSYDQISAIAGISTRDIPVQISYGLIDLQNGSAPDEFWVGTENFYAITQYNRSYFYAMSVYELGRIIKITKEK